MIEATPFFAVNFKKLYPDAVIPKASTEGAVGYDLFAYTKTTDGHRPKLLIPPRTTRIINSGIAIALPSHYWAGVYSRSGLAKEHSLFVANGPGVIDPDYRGEIGVLLYNGGFESYYVQHGDRVAQLVFHDVRHPTIVEVPEFDETERGSNGYGSTGR